MRGCRDASSLHPRRVVVTEEAEELIADSSRLLLVDDAVDGGHTLQTAWRRLRELTTADIRAAALVVTRDDPVRDPDYALFRGVLLRFPWSADTRGADR